MSEDLGQAELELSTDQTKLNKGLDQAKGRTTSFLNDVSKSFKGKFAQSMGQGVGQAFGQQAFRLVEAGLEGIVQGAAGALDAASDLRESLSLAGQVFEGNTAQMAEWADGAAKAFGQSKREALNFAAAFGTTFKNVGFSLDETADKSKVMTRLAADLGSAFNASSEEAATALRSGLLGESEPLRRFGVFLSEAAVGAKALELGIAKAGEKLSDSQKVAARYAIIMEQTADSQGMFGRDTDSLADAQKSLAAQMENLGAKIGQKLLPVAKAAVDVAVGLVDNFENLVPVIAAVGAAVTVVVIPALYRMAAAVIAATGPFAPLAAILAAVGVAMAQGGASIDDYKAKLAELEKTGPLDFLDFSRDKKIQFFKDAIAELERREAEAAAKEKEILEERKKAWAEFGRDLANLDLAGGLKVDDLGKVVDGTIEDIQKGLLDGRYVIKNGAIVMAGEIPKAVKTAGRDAVVATKQSIADMATAIRQGRREIVDAMNAVVDEAYDPLILAADIAATKVELAEQRKIVASKKTTTAERREAARRILDLEKTLATQLNEQTQYGTDAQRLAALTGRATSKELVRGLKSGDEARRLASRAAAADIASGIIALMNKTHNYGYRTGNAYIDGLIQAELDRIDDIKRAHRRIANIFSASSPPGPESPLHKIDDWGYRTGEAWIDPMIAAIANGRRSMRVTLGDIAGDLSRRRFPSLTASVGRLALAGGDTAAQGGSGAFPRSDSWIGRAPDADGSAGSVTKTYIQHVRLEGPPKARDPLAVAKALGRFARTGELEESYKRGGFDRD